MPIPEKEFQDEYKPLWLRETEVEKAINELKKHNTHMYSLVFLVALFGTVGSIVFIKICLNLNKIIELFN